MPTYKTPDVYVEEIPVFPPSVAEVGTAIPAFIGYTAKATKVVDKDLILKPTKIYSLKEYEGLFGFPREETLNVTVTTDTAGAPTVGSLASLTIKYLLYYGVKMFFDNGGTQCYVVSVGTYQTTASITLKGDADTATDPGVRYGLQDGLDVIGLEDEPTLLVIPEAVTLAATLEGVAADYQTLVQAMLLQCGTLKDRFAIIDVYDGTKDLTSAERDANRVYFGNNNLKYGAAYYPFLKTALNYYMNESDTASNVQVTVFPTPAPSTPPSAVDLVTLKATKTAVYNFVKSTLQNYFLVMPPSAGVAGVYAAVDGARGVWKAPANVSLANVLEPIVKIDNIKQADFNVDTTSGKSINVIRAFAGKGNLVWGARTLQGNDNEWRYISVRRFFNMVEESVKKSTYWAVFEPNDANTWVKVRGMIESYLTDRWRDGALAGATPKDAFYVKCGLGTTMSSQDILEGRMNVEIGMAVVRPAEFIILKFSHKMQTS